MGAEVLDGFRKALAERDAGLPVAEEALGDDYKVAFQSCEPSCVEGVWDFVIDYNINQIN